MNNINITVELCAEDRARLDTIIEKLGGMAPRCDKCVEHFTSYVQQSQTPAESAQEAQDAPESVTPTTAAPKAEEATESAQDAPESQQEDKPAPVPLTDLQNEIIRLSRKGLKDKVREVVLSYDVASAGEIPEDKRAEVIEKLKKLEG